MTDHFLRVLKWFVWSVTFRQLFNPAYIVCNKM